MSVIDSKYQDKVGRKQGGALFFMKEDGEFKFWDEDHTGRFLRNVIRSNKVVVITNGSTAATTLSDHGGSSPPVLPSEYGTIILEASDGGTNLSARLASAYSGQRVEIIMRGESLASLVLTFSGATSGITGCHVIGLLHSAAASGLSSITMRVDSVVPTKVVLIGQDDGNWAVIDSGLTATATERRA